MYQFCPLFNAVQYTVSLIPEILHYYATEQEQLIQDILPPVIYSQFIPGILWPSSAISVSGH